MKRFWILLITYLSLLFTACGSAASGSQQSSSAQSGTSTASSTVSGISDVSMDSDTTAASDASAGSDASAASDASAGSDASAASDVSAGSDASAASDASAGSDASAASDVSAGSDTSAASDVSAGSDTSAASDINIMEIDDGLCVVLVEITEMVHPGEAGSSLKSAQAAADTLDFSLGTNLDSESLRDMTRIYYESLHETAADEFPEQLQCVGDMFSALQTEEGESLLADAGVTDSSYPWTDDAFRRAGAIVQACTK